MKKKILAGLMIYIGICVANPMRAQRDYHEPHRLQIHFSPKDHWMNDPNGMVYYKGSYHLFFQYYPGANVWGPMHWGHAASKDLLHWTELPVALYPDSLGYIFSGSAVADMNNTSGFGKKGNPPLVAIYTNHDPKGEKEGTSTFQNQSIAYSLDEGRSWKKYLDNPVLKNPGIKDFRDPKLSWYGNEKKWIMTLATFDRISFFSSRDLKNWTKESDFGKDAGAHGGVWECPDLFSFNYHGKDIWVLLVSINPGGPHGGSATQYFTGQFNGHVFTPYQTQTRWIDGGTDNYAGVTWSNTGNRKIFLGWMSNWEYAAKVPTENWRSAMTIPRELSIEELKGNFYLRSFPVKELSLISEQKTDLSPDAQKSRSLKGPLKLELDFPSLDNFSIELSNGNNEHCTIGFDTGNNSFFIDRTMSGNANFEKEFAKKISSERISQEKGCDIILIIDNSSVEFFADKGLTAMTAIFFPTEDFDTFKLNIDPKTKVGKYNSTILRSIWK